MSYVYPDWPAPGNVKALCTTRLGGHSQGAFDSFNLGDHVGDDPQAVHANRLQLQAELNLQQPPAWLVQVHGTDVACPGEADDYQADASVTRHRGQALAIMTADCLPVLFCDDKGLVVAGAHAGWRGLCAGILEATIQAMAVAPVSLMAWLGPAIGPAAFEVGDEVREAFIAQQRDAAAAFVPGELPGKWLADIYQLARLRLRLAGIERIYGGEYCTVSQPELFYSYRRDRQTGRMASLIWLD
ncbi:peptidoglycan editing factor PgeF [Pokkaliibacter sp. MBI-7]|uniref:peptidoglycan editing factor PgeF n=1 Tax=Pokkaliibacter sp. MBI-7 TaxID=3040600 RepID=UPI0024482313|nr:peptidoglycan editing factor PgeF [Pokkaliibacter sp. MBI-7]MDH2431471.1 peptidoglycan editing factor PgeF [Pokkaliibacter sp. MBI-7]